MRLNGSPVISRLTLAVLVLRVGVAMGRQARRVPKTQRRVCSVIRLGLDTLRRASTQCRIPESLSANKMIRLLFDKTQTAIISYS